MDRFINISSKDNEIIKYVTSLQKSSKRRREEGVFVLEGLRLCYDAIQNGIVPKLLIISASAQEKYSDYLSDFNSTVCYVIPDSLFSKISDTVTPQGLLCVCEIPTNNNKPLSNGKYVALENLQDPSNLGAISRTAEALGISGIVIQGGCDPYSPKSLRASMGALLRIPIYQTEDMFDLFSKCGVKTYAAVVGIEAEKLGDVKFEEGSAVLIGNEANGLSNEAIKKCDTKITIPMSGNAESLNAAVAASIIMWEICK